MRQTSCFRQICRSFNRLQISQSVPRTSAPRQFHFTALRATENAEGEIPAQRKRGRPRKIKPEDTAAPQVESTTAAEAIKESTTELAKPRKAPKIKDISRLIPPTSLSPSPSRPLRPYQEECVEACLKAISEGKRRLGISLATGAGKTVIFTNLIGEVQLEDTKRYQTIILVHRRELVEQAARHCVSVYPDKVPPSHIHRRRD